MTEPTTPTARPEPSTVALPDGRTLAFHDLGDPDGVPCLYMPGSPASGLGGLPYDAPARAAGVRWISVDRPGFGHSSYDPRRSLATVVDDLRALLDSLAVPRAAVVGESGGAPYALALAHDLPARVSKVVVVAGMGPASEAWVRTGMKPRMRRVVSVARYAPWLLRVSMARMARTHFTPERRTAFTAMVLKDASPRDATLLRQHPELIDTHFVSCVDGFRQGHLAAAQELALFAQPWHFSLEDIGVPVELWHGAEDADCPVAIAREAARRLPHCRAHIIEGAGHMVSFEHGQDIVAAVAAAAREDAP